ncbi:MAG: lipid-A-disaccharide synthase N-terminal domain-containing protein [Planctomycetota bacterium]
MWVALGLLGQVLFTGRMLVQWLSSERAKRSVVPPAFWWLSLTGAAMLLAYFIWRTDIVGILGQATGFLIYARNLWLIYMRREPDSRRPTDAGPTAQNPG